MAQDFPTIGGSSQALDAAFDATEKKVESVRSSSYGASAPASKVVGQHWYDGTNEWRWNGAAWELVSPNLQVQTIKGTIDGTNDGVALFYAIAAGNVSRVRLLPNDTVTTDGGNYYSVQLHNVTQGQDLFATAPGTDADEWTAGTVEDMTPDQNQNVAADDILRLTISGTGTPSPTLAEIGVEITITHT